MPAIGRATTWSDEEDTQLRDLVYSHGCKNWSHIASKMPSKSGKQCRRRWNNHLNVTLKKGSWSPEEDRILLDGHTKLGNQWTAIAKLVTGRTDNATKNRYIALTKKKARDDLMRTAGKGSENEAKENSIPKSPAASNGLNVDTSVKVSMLDEETVSTSAFAPTRTNVPPMLSPGPVVRSSGMMHFLNGAAMWTRPPQLLQVLEGAFTQQQRCAFAAQLHAFCLIQQGIPVGLDTLKATSGTTGALSKTFPNQMSPQIPCMPMPYPQPPHLSPILIPPIPLPNPPITPSATQPWPPASPSAGSPAEALRQALWSRLAAESTKPMPTLQTPPTTPPTNNPGPTSRSNTPSINVNMEQSAFSAAAVMVNTPPLATMPQDIENKFQLTQTLNPESRTQIISSWPGVEDAGQAPLQETRALKRRIDSLLPRSPDHETKEHQAKRGRKIESGSVVTAPALAESLGLLLPLCKPVAVPLQA